MISFIISCAAVALALGSLCINLWSGRRLAALSHDGWTRLRDIGELEVHGGEFIDAAELYRILDKPIPEPIDHAANIRNPNHQD